MIIHIMSYVRSKNLIWKGCLVTCLLARIIGGGQEALQFTRHYVRRDHARYCQSSVSFYTNLLNYQIRAVSTVGGALVREASKERRQEKGRMLCGRPSSGPGRQDHWSSEEEDWKKTTTGSRLGSRLPIRSKATDPNIGRAG